MAIYGTLGGQDSTTTGYPSIQPTLDLNFAKTKALDPRITFYRNSLATYVDDKGIIRTVPENVPRFDHDPTTGESLGLLIEEGRTNLMFPSNIGNTILNDGNGVTLTTDTIVSTPLGDFSGVLKCVHTTNTPGYFRRGQVLSLTAGVTYTFSFFFKNDTVVNPYNRNSNEFGITITTFTPTFEAIQASLTTNISYPNGWYKQVITFTPTLNQIYQVNFNQANSQTPVGTYYLWGFQLEQGSFATSYIPTSGSTVTRSADICYIDGTNFSSWYNSNGGAAYIDVIPRGISNSLPYQVYFSFNSTSGDRWGISHQNGTSGSYTSNAVLPYVGTGGAFSNTLAGTFTPGQRISVAMNQPNGTNIESSRDGASVQSVSTSRNPAVNNLLLGGLISDNSGLMGNIKRFMYYPKRLTNTQLQNLTA